MAGIQAFLHFCWPGLANRMPAGACLRNPQACLRACLKHACALQACLQACLQGAGMPAGMPEACLHAAGMTAGMPAGMPEACLQAAVMAAGMPACMPAGMPRASPGPVRSPAQGAPERCLSCIESDAKRSRSVRHGLKKPRGAAAVSVMGRTRGRWVGGKEDVGSSSLDNIILSGGL